MKTLDVKYLQESIQQTKLDIESMQEEIEAIQSAVRDFYSLEGAFEGQAGDAIRHFYQDTHEPFLIFFQQSLSDYQAALDKISDAVFSYESNPKGYVSQDYLASDVPQGLQRAGNEAQQLTTEAQAIINNISDLVSIPAFDESGVMDAVRTGKQQADESIQGLVELDQQGVAHLKSTQTDLDKMDAFLSDMKSTFSSKQSLTSYSATSVQSMTSYQELQERIKTDHNVLDSIFTGNNFANLTLLQIQQLKNAHLNDLSPSDQEKLNDAFILLKNGTIDQASYGAIQQNLVEAAVRKNGAKNLKYFWNSYGKDLTTDFTEESMIMGGTWLFKKANSFTGPKGPNQFVLVPKTKNPLLKMHPITMNKVGKGIKAVGITVGLVGAGFEFAGHMKSGHTPGVAVTRTAGTIAATQAASVLGIGAVNAGLAALNLALLPTVGVAALGTVGIGMGLAFAGSIAFDSFYENNTFGVKTGVDRVGKAINPYVEPVVDGVRSIKKSIGHRINKVGEAMIELKVADNLGVMSSG